ncbi:Epoxide hydrolase 3 [Entomophthora muscae]|uniref:Epoxide hydrolase 3 n=1 Tax=Entomophthora muscae TaxID=34485 RepID=A0ACC2SRM2_9FUNG|nr:Epoxide hydrolase 3 [Entomophthora muscae]
MNNLSSAHRLGVKASPIEEAEFEYSHLTLNDLNYHYVMTKRCKDSILCLFLHGFPETWYSWKRMLNVFRTSTEFTSLAIDLVGVGSTDAPRDLNRYSFESVSLDLELLIQHLGFDSVVIVGHNWGNHVGFHLARTRPNLVRAMISISSGYFPEPTHPKSLIEKFPVLGYQLNLAKEENCRQFDENLEVFIDSFWCYKYPSALESCLAVPPHENFIDFVNAIPEKKYVSPDDEIKNYTLSQFKKTGTWGATNWYRTFEINRQFASSISNDLMLHLPVLLISGEEDFSVSKITAGTEYLKNFVVQYIPKAGHFVHVSHAEEIGNSILDWLNANLK